MNEKSKFPFLGLIMVFVLFAAAMFLMCFIFWPSWRIRSFDYMPIAPWFFLIPIFFILMIAMCIWICKGRKHWSNMCNWDDRQKEPLGQNPVEILKTRLAKGEIKEEEYDRLLEKISREKSCC